MFTSNDERTGRFTFEAEGSIQPSSPYFIGKLCQPSAESGVTIGAGYDMKGRSEAQVKADLTAAGLAADLAGKLAKGAGLKTIDAKKFVDDNKKTLYIADVQVLRNLFAKIYPGYVTTAQNNFRYHAPTFKTAMKSYGHQYESAIFFDWTSLYPSIRVIAVDFAYQGFGRAAPGFGRPMHFCMANNFEWLIHYIETTPGLKKYEAGRHRANYLRANMKFEISAYSQSKMP